MEPTPNNLPLQLSSFIGRDQEIPEVKRLLTTTRLLTLTGSGGTGKTRLTLQVAGEVLDQFTDGVWFIGLAPLSDPALVPVTIASALGVREEPGRSLATTLLEWLRPKQLLLMLDNCEHLIEACAKFADAVLHAAPQLKILATTREALGVTGESVWRVPSLPTPNPTESLTLGPLEQYAAVRLFIERATQSLATFRVTNANAPAVAQICYRLDGIPLAIELAATRVKAMRVEQIAARLNDRFQLLTGGSRTALPRHQTLRATMDWSHNLLNERERVVLRRLSVFAGGWTLEAAEEVTSGRLQVASDKLQEPDLQPADILDLLTRLVDKSLVVLDEQATEPRYRMLETIRQYAREKLLESGEGDAVSDRHLEFYVALAERADPMLRTAQRAEWLALLETEHDNLRAALEWAGERNPEIARRLAGLLRWFWFLGDHFTDAYTWYRRLLGSSERPAKTKGTALALLGAGIVFVQSQAREEARGFLEQAVDAWKALDDPGRLAESVHWLAYTRLLLGQAEEAYVLYQTHEAFFHRHADPLTLAFALSFLGRSLAIAQGDYAAAKALQEEGLAVAKRGRDPIVLGGIYQNLGFWSLQQGDYDAAGRYHLEGLAWRRKAGSRSQLAASLEWVADMACLQRDYIQARPLYDEALALNRAIGAQLNAASVLARRGYLLVQEGDVEQAAKCLAESLEVFRERVSPFGIAVCLAGYAELGRVQGQVGRAVRLLASPALLPAVGRRASNPVYRIEHERSLATIRAQLDEATFNTAWEAGRALTMELTLAEAERIVAESIVTVATPLPTSMPAISTANPAGLTAREVDVLRLLAQGLTDAQIAEALVVSPRTVNSHLRSIYSKLDVTTRTAAARVAIEHKIV